MPRLVAASISMTSVALPWRISMQESQTPQGSGVGRWRVPISVRQFRAWATMRAMVVLPMPRWPEKM
jgi:hypothetical protein